MLDELAGAIDEAQWPRALVLALEAWRAARSPALADLIDALSARCPRAPAPRRDQQEHWMRAALAYDPVEACALLDLVHHRSFKGDSPWKLVVERLGDDDPIITRLLATARASVQPRVRIDELPTHQRNRIERLCALVRWPDDPRVATVLAKWFVHDGFLWEDPHHHGPRIVLEVLAAQLVRLGDARVVPAIADCIERPRARTPALREAQRQLARQILEGITAPPGDDPRTLQAVSTLAPALPHAAVDDRALWDAIAREPDALAPRLVLGDYLLERGDTRGEMFALQCAGDSKSAMRADQLLADHWNEWLGDLALVLKRGDSVFERGTLATAMVGLESTPGWAYQAVADHRELSTVTRWMYSQHIKVEDYVGLLASQARPLSRVAMRAFDFPLFGAVRPRWQISAIDLALIDGFRGSAANRCGLIFAEAIRLFPSLEELHLRYYPHLPDLADAVPLLARLPALRLIRIPVMRTMADADKSALRALAAAMPIVELVE